MASVSSLLNKGSSYLRNLAGAKTRSSSDRFMFPFDVDQYPRMVIMAKSKNSAKVPDLEVFLQIPQSVAIGDTHQFGGANLGVIGKAAQDALTGLGNNMTAQGAASAIQKTASNLASGINGQNASTKAAAVAQILEKTGAVKSDLVKAAAEAVMYNQRKITNPNQVNQFTGTNIRTFAFDFKLVGTSKAENEMIRSLVSQLRAHSYAGGDDYVLEYPSVFQMEFLTADGKVNPYITQIYDCYLMSMTTTYNSTSNAFYEDGAPLEVSIALSFQETKALTRDDIKAMENRAKKSK